MKNSTHLYKIINSRARISAYISKITFGVYGNIQVEVYLRFETVELKEDSIFNSIQSFISYSKVYQ